MHRRLKVQKSSNINGKIFPYLLYYDNGISEVPVKDSNNNAIVKELKQELENNRIIDKLQNKIDELENNSSKLQNENNEIKKNFDEYKERHAENVKRHGYKSATNNECVDKINRISEFLNNLLRPARDELLSLKATDQSTNNKAEWGNMARSYIPQRIVESSTI